MQRQLARALEMLEQQQTQIAAHDTSIARLDRILMDLLTGRLWRTLRAAGQLVSRFLPSPARDWMTPWLLEVVTTPFWSATSRLRRISGLGADWSRSCCWCLAEHGVDAVQIEVPGIPVIETKPVLPRPDERQRPDLDRTGRAGFAAEFDSNLLRTGRHTIALRVISRGEVVATHRTAVNIDHVKGYSSDYDRWISEFEKPDDEIIELKLLSLSYRPLISILMPVFNTEPAELKAAVESVLNQSYSNWELCIADDCSSRPEIGGILNDFAIRDARIKVTFESQRGGISRASNAAWALCNGDFVCFLDHDDSNTE